MPLIHPADRKLVFSAAAVLILLLAMVAFLQPDEEVEEPFPSTYSSHSGGAKATYLLIQELGYKIERYDHRFAELPSAAENTTLILAKPLRYGNSEDHAGLRRFLENGGSVIAAGESAAFFLPDASAFPAVMPKEAWSEEKAGAPSDLNVGIPVITTPRRGRWISSNPNQLTVYGSGNDPAVVAYRLGKGRIIWYSSPAPLTNAGLKAKGNAEFLSRLLNATHTDRVLWDVHYSEEPRALASSFTVPPILWGSAQLLFVMSAVMWTFSRRSGPLRPPVQIARLSPVEFVDTLGGLYRRTRSANLAVDIAYRHFLDSCTSRFGIARQTSRDAIAEIVARQTGIPAQDVANTLAECEIARFEGNLPPASSLELTQQLYDYQSRLKMLPRMEEE